jgi:hypothetical protein
MHLTAEMVLKLARATERVAGVRVHRVERGFDERVLRALAAHGQVALTDQLLALVADARQQLEALCALDTVRELLGGAPGADRALAERAERAERACLGLCARNAELEQRADAARARADAAEARARDAEARARDAADARARDAEARADAAERAERALRARHEDDLIECMAARRGHDQAERQREAQEREQLLHTATLALQALRQWVRQLEANAALGRALTRARDRLRLEQTRRAHLMRRLAACAHIFDRARAPTEKPFAALFADALAGDDEARWHAQTRELVDGVPPEAMGVWKCDPDAVIDPPGRLDFVAAPLTAFSAFCEAVELPSPYDEAVAPRTPPRSVEPDLTAHVEAVLHGMHRAKTRAVLPAFGMLLQSAARFNHAADALRFATDADADEAVRAVLAHVLADACAAASADAVTLGTADALHYEARHAGAARARRFVAFRLGLRARRRAVDAWYPLWFASFDAVALAAQYARHITGLAPMLEGRPADGDASATALAVPDAFLGALASCVRETPGARTQLKPMRCDGVEHAVRYAPTAKRAPGRQALLDKAVANHAFLGNGVQPVWAGELGADDRAMTPAQLTNARRKLGVVY